VTARAAEGSAPCPLELAASGPGGPGLAVAIDRRATCRVEEGDPGPPHPLAAQVLRAFGVEGAARVVTKLPGPEGSGLGERSALAVAVAGAVAAAFGRGPDRETVARVAEEALREAGGETTTAGGEVAAAVRGGVIAVERGPAGACVGPLPVDPARVEESLVLVDTGGADPADGAAPGAPDAGLRARAALLDGRFEELVDLWVEEWEARRRLAPGWPPAEAARVEAVVRAAGGGARLCGGHRGRLLAVWAPPGARGPGRRESVLAALRAAGLRPLSVRVDLRGLEAERERTG
jgi:galactokinase/mevalonate kinase-like predicted kinase